MNENKIRDLLNKLYEAVQQYTETAKALDDEGISFCGGFTNFFGKAKLTLQTVDSIEQLAAVLGTDCGEYDLCNMHFRYFIHDGIEIREIKDEVSK